MKKTLILTITLLMGNSASAMNEWAPKEPNARALAAVHAPVRTAMRTAVAHTQFFQNKKLTMLKALNQPVASHGNCLLPLEIRQHIIDYAMPHFSHNPEIENRWLGCPQLLRVIPVVSDPGTEPYASKLGWIYVSQAGSAYTNLNNYDQYEPLEFVQAGLLNTNHDNDIHFSPDEYCVAIKHGRSIYFHDLKNKNLLRIYRSSSPGKVIFSPDNTKGAIYDKIIDPYSFYESYIIDVIDLKDKSVSERIYDCENATFYFTNDSKYLIVESESALQGIISKTTYDCDTKESSYTTITDQDTKPRSLFNPAYEATLDDNNILTIRPFEKPNILLQVYVPFNAKFLNFSRHGKTFRLYNKDTHEIYEYGFKSLHEQVAAETAYAQRKQNYYIRQFNIAPTLPVPQQENINTEDTAQLNA